MHPSMGTKKPSSKLPSTPATPIVTYKRTILDLVQSTHNSMATTRNNNGDGRKNHLSSLQLQDGSRPYRQTYAYYYSQNSGNDTDDDRKDFMLPMVFVVITVVVVLLRILCCGLHKADAAAEEDQDAGAGEDDRVDQPPPPRPPPESNDEAGERRWAAADGDVALVCTYSMKADGCVEEGSSSCGVCLADMADGEVLRVLPACLHYFHAACVDEWLDRHATCPLCRAPLVVGHE